MIDISIAIVAYRNYEDVIEAVSSIEKYTSKMITKQIYIIDNSCFPEADEERCIFIRKIDQYSDVSYIESGANLGFGKGNNLVLDMLDSRFHAIVNPDIMLLEDTLKKMMEFMSDDNIGMSIPKIVNQDGAMQYACRREVTVWDMFVRMFCKSLFVKRYRYHTLQKNDYSKPFYVPFGQASFLVIRTSIFKELKGFDERYFLYLEDADLCKRVNEISNLVYCPYTTVVHRWGRSSHKSFKMFKCHISSMIKYFGKWGVKWF